MGPAGSHTDLPPPLSPPSPSSVLGYPKARAEGLPPPLTPHTPSMGFGGAVRSGVPRPPRKPPVFPAELGNGIRSTSADDKRGGKEPPKPLEKKKLNI